MLFCAKMKMVDSPVEQHVVSRVRAVKPGAHVGKQRVSFSNPSFKMLKSLAVACWAGKLFRVLNVSGLFNDKPASEVVIEIHLFRLEGFFPSFIGIFTVRLTLMSLSLLICLKTKSIRPETVCLRLDPVKIVGVQVNFDIDFLGHYPLQIHPPRPELSRVVYHSPKFKTGKALTIKYYTLIWAQFHSGN